MGGNNPETQNHCYYLFPNSKLGLQSPEGNEDFRSGTWKRPPAQTGKKLDRPAPRILAALHDSGASTTTSFHSTQLLAFDILASKRRSKSRIRSKPRSRSRSRSKDRKESPIFVHFVIPLAALLSSVTARLYDMGGPSATPQAHDDPERAPLLGGSQRKDSNPPEAPAKKAGQWVARNAVIIFMSLLILVVILVICIFFGSKSLKPIHYLECCG
jgi:hypothetical protein